MKYMTKIFYSLCLVSFFFVAQQPVLALEIITPIQVEILESPAQKITHLQNTYGTSNYYKCYESNHCGSVSSAPGAQSSCLSLIELCLIEMQRREKVIETATDGFSNSAVQCPAKMINQNGTCVCDKAKGYVSQNGGCFLPIAGTVPQKSNDQICQDNYGSNSNWYGTKNSNDGLVCGCKTGYQWNQGQTQCVATTNKTTPKSETIIKSLPAEIKPLITNSVDIASTTTVDTVATEQTAQIGKSTAESNNKSQPKQSVFKEIAAHGFFPWLFRSISKWFQR